MFFERVAIIGVGLIGGSFALALKERQLCGQAVGAGRSVASLEEARARGAIDAIERDAAAAASGADLVLVAAPVAQFEAIFLAIAPRLKPECLVMDAGSTKRDVVEAARRGLGSRLAQFVPSHPIAGAEKSGAAAASAALFQGKRVVLTPLPESAPGILDKAAAAWGACGARVSRMTAEEHDAVFAAVSHLPHLLAFALVHDIASRPEAAQLFGYAAGGFRDFTRIASSHPEMWRDICTANRDRLLQELARFDTEMGRIRRMLAQGDAEALEKLFTDARAARERWLSGEYE
jgi:prephenate dehydrogenase